MFSFAALFVCLDVYELRTKTEYVNGQGIEVAKMTNGSRLADRLLISFYNPTFTPK
jgi:hypothetical protein